MSSRAHSPPYFTQVEEHDTGRIELITHGLAHPKGETDRAMRLFNTSVSSSFSVLNLFS